MPLVSGNITSTETSAVGVDLIAAMVQSYLSENAVLIPSILDVSNEVEPGAKSVSIGRHTGLTAESLTEGSSYTAQKFTWSADQLIFNKHEGVRTNLTTKAAAQSTKDQEANILTASIEALAQKLEAQVYTALADVSGATPDHKVALDTADTLSYEDILNARRLLNKQSVPKDNNRFLAINSDQEMDILGLDKFSSADKYGNNIPLLTGEIGRILGFRVLVTENVTASTALAYHSSHAVFARQKEITWFSQFDPDYSYTKYLLETMYGLKTLDSGKRGVLLNNTGA